MSLKNTLCIATFLLTLNGSLALAAEPSAVMVSGAIHAPIMAAAHAGSRIVAAGEHGVILLSDDDGNSFHQARTVPTQALLTSLSFIDDKQGWAAGHDGVVLHTENGGNTWTLQREDLKADNPLLSIRFRDAQHGLAVGLFGTAVQTADGGNTWTPLSVESGEETDHHLNFIFGDGAPMLYIAGEAGLIYRSTNGGTTWTTVKTSNIGSFWTGIQLKSGRLLTAGQRGHLFSSDDQGLTWTEIPSGTDQSLTDIVQSPDGTILITGLAGVTLSSTDGGKTFALHERADRAPLTAACIDGGNTVLLFGTSGPVANGN
ncbi:MAG: WD40/YVTN/BNR-like repeat-containing protein [Stenotrophobium sp.]